MSDWGKPSQHVQRGTNAANNPCLAKGHHRPLPERTPVVWLLYLAFEHFLPRWQAARDQSRFPGPW